MNQLSPSIHSEVSQYGCIKTSFLRLLERGGSHGDGGCSIGNDLLSCPHDLQFSDYSMLPDNLYTCDILIPPSSDSSCNYMLT